MIRSGMRPPSPKTGTGFSAAMCCGSSWKGFWIAQGSSPYCRTSISRSTARSSRPGPRTRASSPKTARMTAMARTFTARGVRTTRITRSQALLYGPCGHGEPQRFVLIPEGSSGGEGATAIDKAVDARAGQIVPDDLACVVYAASKGALGGPRIVQGGVIVDRHRFAIELGPDATDPISAI